MAVAQSQGRIQPVECFGTVPPLPVDLNVFVGESIAERSIEFREDSFRVGTAAELFIDHREAHLN